MTTPADTTGDELVILTPEQAWELFDQDARRLFHMSGAEWLRAYDAGEIDVDDPAVHSDAIWMEMQIGCVRGVAPE